MTKRIYTAKGQKKTTSVSTVGLAIYLAKYIAKTLKLPKQRF